MREIHSLNFNVFDLSVWGTKLFFYFKTLSSTLQFKTF